MDQDLEENSKSMDSEDITPEVIASLVRELSITMKDTGVSRVSIKHNNLQIKLSTMSGIALNRNSSGSEKLLDSLTHTEENTTNVSEDYVITAPMIGTFYVSPAPNEPSFVQIGDTIEEGQTIGIIEAMKIMNEIAADRAGRVSEIVAADGDTVEYGSPLVVLTPVSS